MKSKEAIKFLAFSGISFLAGLIGLATAAKNIKRSQRLTGGVMAVTALLNLALGIIQAVKYIGKTLCPADDSSDCDFLCDGCSRYDKCYSNKAEN